MITISDRAMQRIVAIEVPVGRVLRLDLQRSGQPNLTFGGARPDDTVVRHGDVEVLYVSAAVRATFQDTVFDTGDSRGDAFVLTPGHSALR